MKNKKLTNYFNKKYPIKKRIKIKTVEVGHPDDLELSSRENLLIENFHDLEEFKVVIYTDKLKKIKFSLNSIWKLKSIIIIGNYRNSNNICKIFEGVVFPNLRNILITDCNLKTFPNLNNNFNFLSCLNLEKNNLSNILFIKTLVNLKKLHLNENEIKEVCLKDYEIQKLKLEEVYLENNFLDNSEASLLLENLKELRVISLQKNCLKGDLVIRSLSLKLNTFFANDNLIEKLLIINLKDLKNIKKFWISDNLISDYSFIKLLNNNIRSLAISNNRFDINLKDLNKFSNLSYLTMGTDNKNKLKNGIKNNITGNLTDLNLNKIEWLCIENTFVKGNLICLKNSPLRNAKFSLDNFKGVTPFWTTNTPLQNLLKSYEFNLNLYFLDFEYQTNNLSRKNALNSSLIKEDVENRFIESSYQISDEKFIAANSPKDARGELIKFSKMSTEDFVCQRKVLWKEILNRNSEILTISADLAFKHLKFDIKEVNQSSNNQSTLFINWLIISLSSLSLIIIITKYLKSNNRKVIKC
ncbi:MAG: hypothetical protein AM1032_000406 [Mycoplasmataceae bacterium]|nr:MAG: hypothetical protein AM1032_000406 [Mycoplasmataceae bacterium]